MGKPEEKVFEKLIKVSLTESDAEKYFLIGSSLNPEEQEELTLFLRQNSDIFAWEPYDCLGLNA